MLLFVLRHHINDSKHLLKTMLCISFRDISFLYDVHTTKGKSEKPNLGDESELRHGEADDNKHVSNMSLVFLSLYMGEGGGRGGETGQNVCVIFFPSTPICTAQLQ